MDSNFVLIIGAGPTGLTLANALACNEIPFRIIDERSGPTSDSKGLAVNVSSQYGLQLIGIDKIKSSQGKHIERLNIHWNGKRFSSINFNHLSTEICSLITQPQSETENLLLENLAKLGHAVEWNTRAEDISVTEHFATVKITITNNISEESQFHYIIGCDGKRSIVRKFVSPTFDGIEYQMHFILGDFEFKSNFPCNEVQYFVYEDLFFILVPIGENTWRAVVKCEGLPSKTPATATDIASIINNRIGYSIIPDTSRWISKAPFYTKFVSTLRSGRLFLAGDAAHLFSPIGGTGMNTGIQDALNLAWKLSFVYKKQSSSKLLDSYQEERFEMICENAASVDLATQLIARKLLSHPLLTSLEPKMKNRKFLRSIVPTIHSGLNSSFSSQARFSDVTKYMPDRSECHPFFLNMLTNISKTKNVRLYSKISIVVIGEFENIDEHIQLCNELHLDNQPINVIYVNGIERVIHQKNNYNYLCYEEYIDNSLLKGISHGIYVIRPDGFTALHLSHNEITLLPNLLIKYFLLNKFSQNELCNLEEIYA